MKKIGFLLLAAGMLFSTVGCEKIVQVPAVPYATATEEKQAEWEQEVPSYDPIPLNVPEVEREAVQEVGEAEEETTQREPLEYENRVQRSWICYRTKCRRKGFYHPDGGSSDSTALRSDHCFCCG